MEERKKFTVDDVMIIVDQIKKEGREKEILYLVVSREYASNPQFQSVVKKFEDQGIDVRVATGWKELMNEQTVLKNYDIGLDKIKVEVEDFQPLEKSKIRQTKNEYRNRQRFHKGKL